jgi:hypothetical protein
MYWVSGILGAGLMLLPFLMGYTDVSTVLWSSIILGLIALGVSIYKGVTQDQARWEYIVVGIVGLLAVFAPFMFGFSTLTLVVWAFVIIGGVMAIFGGYEGFFARPQTK